MKFYIASKIEDKQKVKDFIKLLKSRGHKITRDWTREKHVIRPYHLNSAVPKNETFQKVKLHLTKDEIAKKSAHIAKQDIDAVTKSDVFVVLVSKDVATGYNVELGAAIAHYKLKKSPKIYLVGPYNNRSALYYHPSINRVSDVSKISEAK